MGDGTPKVMRISFQIHISRGVGGNIRQLRLEKAFDTIIGAVRGLVPSVMPWADRIVVRKEWLYDWTDTTEEYRLPRGEANTPPTDDDPDNAEPTDSD